MVDREESEPWLDDPVATSAAVPPRSRGETLVRAWRSSVVRRVQLPSQAFIHTEEVSGIVLLLAALLALVWANSPAADSYHALWATRIAVSVGPWTIAHDLRHWINDAVMTLFFFVVGLEVRRELAAGALSGAGRAALPVAAAIGGMAVPALVYLAVVGSGPSAAGWGIPVATDIAFALAVLALVGRRLPGGARVLLLSLAAADDVGGILVIALAYSESVTLAPLAAALLALLLVVVLRGAGLRHVLPYLALAVILWLGVAASGVHPTLTGVALGLLAPVHREVGLRQFAGASRRLVSRLEGALTRRDDAGAATTLGQFEALSRGTETPQERLERTFHPWVSFVVLPVFALGNAGVTLSGEPIVPVLTGPVALGVIAGLVVGKPVGVVAASWLAVRLGLAELPPGLGWRHLVGLGILAGIGFTVSLFIGDLAFRASDVADEAKLGILVASLLAGVAGYTWLRLTSSAPERPITRTPP